MKLGKGGIRAYRFTFLEGTRNYKGGGGFDCARSESIFSMLDVYHLCVVWVLSACDSVMGATV